MKNFRPIVVMILGRPGSGKDTQAELLAQKYNLIRIETSKLLQEEFKKAALEGRVSRLDSESERAPNSEIGREKIIFESGELNTPSWVAAIVKKNISFLNIKKENKNGIIFSGSPRTLYEAENLLPFLEEKFGEENIFGIFLNITEEEGIKRIIKRAARPLDRDPKILKIRMKEFDERTAPILDLFKKKSILKEIDGMPAPGLIFKNIVKILNLK